MLATGKWIKKRMRNLASHVKLNANELGQVNSQKLLSVKMDQNLSFDDHIDGLCNTLSQRIAVLRRIKRFLPRKQRIAYHDAMIERVAPSWL